MGEVYRAHDHTLHRDVAIKVLPAAFSADRERLARFEREARLLASLNHPHIGAIYGLEGTGDLRALVLELIDGETLQARLGRGPIPTAQALTLAVQIAEALDHAHRRGVTHRDLKPANIMLTKAGRQAARFRAREMEPRRMARWVCLRRADAAEAERRGESDEEGDDSRHAALHGARATRRQAVDARADVFAFGAVLYEMLTGRKAFDGGSAAAVMAAVLNTEPPALDTIQSTGAAFLERVVRKCLAKDPDERWQTARDLADELKWIADEVADPADVDGGQASTPGWIGPGCGAVAIALALAGMGRMAASRLARTFSSWARHPLLDPALSRDAVRPVRHFSRRHHAASTQLQAAGSVCSSGASISLRDAPIAGTDGAKSPLFSPDGQWVAFFSGRAAAEGQRPGQRRHRSCSPMASTSWLNSATWLDDGTIIFSRPQQGLQRVSAEGGEPWP